MMIESSGLNVPSIFLRGAMPTYLTKLFGCIGVALLLGSNMAFAVDCSDVGDNSINDALVANLEQQADAAETRAATATNYRDRARWEAVARNIRAQARSAESRQQILGSAARKACDVLLNNDDD